MNRLLLTASCLGLGALTWFGQTPEASSFEVATVKPAPPDRKQFPDAFAEVLINQGGPGTMHPERIDYPGMTLKRLLQRAYKLRAAEISGPKWLDSERYDVVAKVPPGTDEAGFLLMLQGLLTERFQIVSHREDKILPVYLLTVAKGGLKIKPVVKAPVSDDPESRRAARTSTPEEELKRAHALIRGGSPWASFGVHGTAEQFAEALSRRMDRLVRDMTQLNGIYGFQLTYVVDGAKSATPDGGVGPFIFEAIEEQLGLRLQPANNKSEVLVIDKAEKVPTSN